MARWKPTEEQIQVAERLSQIGMTQEKIARILGVCYDAYLFAQKKNDALRQRIIKAMESGDAQVHQSLFKMATSGNCPAATIFWMKVRSRWKEPSQALEFPDRDGNPQQISQQTIVLLPAKNGN